jgi:AraC family transcriptional regulator, activator of mtrCDE
MTMRSPLIRPPETQLRQLMRALEIDFVRLTECVVSPGWRLSFGGSDIPSVHYNLAGEGRIVVEGHDPVSVEPHTLVIIPANKPFRFEVDGPGGALTTLKLARPSDESHGAFHRFEAGNGDPRMTLICGSFRAHHGTQDDVFGGLQTPIVEQFSPEDRLDERMKDAFAELLAQEEGDGTMAAALLKQVVVKLLRRSVASNELWVERLSVLQDPQIARAFAAMIARPGANHTTDTLSAVAGMSRSVFMERFTRLFDQSPISVLRVLRLNYAKELLGKPTASIDRVAHEVGYSNRGSFGRAFKDEFGEEPVDYREKVLALRSASPLPAA